MHDAYPRLTAHEANQDVLDEEDQEALSYYLSGGGRHQPIIFNYETERRSETSRYQGPERRSQTRLIDGQIYTMVGMKMSSSGESERDRALSEFEDYTPMSHAEASSLISGPEERLVRASKTKQGNKESAVRKTYDDYIAWLVEAAHDMHILNGAMEQKSDGTVSPSTNQLRSREILELAAVQLMYRGFVWENYWPARSSDKYKEREKYWRGFALAASRYASDEALEELYASTRQRTTKRFKRWMKEKAAIDRLPMIQNLKERQIIADPTELNRYLNEKARQIEFAGRGDQLTMEAPQPASDHEAAMPAELRRQLEEARRSEETRVSAANEEFDRELEAEIEKLAGSNFGWGKSSQDIRDEAARRVKKKGIEPAMLKSEIRDLEDEQEIAEISERARRIKLPKRSPRRKGRGPRWGQSGYNADADKKVEDTYPKLF